MAEPRYCVTVIFSIGVYVGDWTGKEERMEQQYQILCQSPSREYAELLYKRVCALDGLVIGDSASPRVMPHRPHVFGFKSKYSTHSQCVNCNLSDVYTKAFNIPCGSEIHSPSEEE